MHGHSLGFYLTAVLGRHLHALLRSPNPKPFESPAISVNLKPYFQSESMKTPYDLRISLYIYIYTHRYVDIYVYIYIYIHMYRYISLHIYIYISLSLSLSIYLCICIYIYTYLYLCLFTRPDLPLRNPRPELGTLNTKTLARKAQTLKPIVPLTLGVHIPNTWVLGIWVIVIIVQVLGKYMILRYLDP